MEHKYLFVAVDAALKAGEEILSIYTDPASDFEIERKADHSPLTIADRKAHVTIATILDETPFPVLSEEGKHLEYDTRRNWDVMWIVDPLDGTKEFIKRNGELFTGQKRTLLCRSGNRCLQAVGHYDFRRRCNT